MCASCKCGCKPGRPEKGCDCTCKMCREARMSVSKSLADLANWAYGEDVHKSAQNAAVKQARKLMVLRHPETRRAGNWGPEYQRDAEQALKEANPRGSRSAARGSRTSGNEREWSAANYIRAMRDASDNAVYSARGAHARTMSSANERVRAAATERAKRSAKPKRTPTVRSRVVESAGNSVDDASSYRRTGRANYTTPDLDGPSIFRGHMSNNRNSRRPAYLAGRPSQLP